MRVCESTNQMSRWGVLLTNARSKLFDLLQVSRFTSPDSDASGKY